MGLIRGKWQLVNSEDNLLLIVRSFEVHACVQHIYGVPNLPDNAGG